MLLRSVRAILELFILLINQSVGPDIITLNRTKGPRPNPTSKTSTFLLKRRSFWEDYSFARIPYMLGLSRGWSTDYYNSETVFTQKGFETLNIFVGLVLSILPKLRAPHEHAELEYVVHPQTNQAY